MTNNIILRFSLDSLVMDIFTTNFNKIFLTLPWFICFLLLRESGGDCCLISSVVDIGGVHSVLASSVVDIGGVHRVLASSVLDHGVI
jgi:hypothetical protein